MLWFGFAAGVILCSYHGVGYPLAGERSRNAVGRSAA